MVTVISGTHRVNSNTLKISKIYESIIKEKSNEEVKLFSLVEFSEQLSMKDLYQYHHPSLQKIIDEYILNSDKIIIVAPEYNGTFPGILKLFIDSIRPELFKNKKIALVGVATGRGGNLRGLDQLTNAFHYLGAEILSHKLPLSRINETIFPKDKENKDLLAALEVQLKYQFDLLLKF